VTLARSVTFSVQAITLDGFSHRSSLSSIRAIKIDAEGSEAAIIRGAKRSCGIFGRFRSSSSMTGSHSRHKPRRTRRSDFASHSSKNAILRRFFKNFGWSPSSRSVRRLPLHSERNFGNGPFGVEEQGVFLSARLDRWPQYWSPRALDAPLGPGTPSGSNRGQARQGCRIELQGL
jgi:hypothetical protein